MWYHFPIRISELTLDFVKIFDNRGGGVDEINALQARLMRMAARKEGWSCRASRGVDGGRRAKKYLNFVDQDDDDERALEIGPARLNGFPGRSSSAAAGQ